MDGGSGMSSTWTWSLSSSPWFAVRLAPKRRSTGGVGLWLGGGVPPSLWVTMMLGGASLAGAEAPWEGVSSGKTARMMSGDRDPCESRFLLCVISWSACCSNWRACSLTLSLGSRPRPRPGPGPGPGPGLPSSSESRPRPRPESRPASLLSLNSALRSSSSHCTGSITTCRLSASHMSLRCSRDGSVQLCPPAPHLASPPT